MHAEHAARKLTIRKNALSGYARFKVRAVDGEWMVKESRSHSKSQLMNFLIICFQYRDNGCLVTRVRAMARIIRSD